MESLKWLQDSMHSIMYVHPGIAFVYTLNELTQLHALLRMFCSSSSSLAVIGCKPTAPPTPHRCIAALRIGGAREIENRLLLNEIADTLSCERVLCAAHTGQAHSIAPHLRHAPHNYSCISALIIRSSDSCESVASSQSSSSASPQLTPSRTGNRFGHRLRGGVLDG